MEENNDNNNNDEKTQKNNIKVNLNDFELLQTVGLGSFGRVRLAHHKKKNKIYVMKILKKNRNNKTKTSRSHLFRI